MSVTMAQALNQALRDAMTADEKVLVFTEYKDTAEYIGARLAESLGDQPDVGITVTLTENPRAKVSYTVPGRP